MVLIVLYMSSNMLGLAVHVLRHRVIHRGFEDTKHSVEARIRLEHEQQQQVKTPDSAWRRELGQQQLVTKYMYEY